MTAPRPSHHVDEYRGHVVVMRDTVDSTVAVLLDMGDVVRMDGKFLGPWTEDEAREVGVALIGWAGRKRLARAGKVKEEA